MSTIVINLTREEAMACLLGLQKEHYKHRRYKWAQQALTKVEKALNLQPYRPDHSPPRCSANPAA